MTIGISKEKSMNAPSIQSPTSDEHIHVLMKNPVALFIDDHEEKRGMVINIDLSPSDKTYSAILEIDLSEYESCTLGFIEEQKIWVSIEKDASGTWCRDTNSRAIDIRRAAPMTHNKD